MAFDMMLLVTVSQKLLEVYIVNRKNEYEDSLATC